MTKINLSFKRGPKPTGLYAVGHPYPDTEIKLNKQKVGWISPPNTGASLRQDPHWRVWTARNKEVTQQSPCPFKNICFAAKFDNEEDARAWVTRNWTAITALDLYLGGI